MAFSVGPLAENIRTKSSMQSLHQAKHKEKQNKFPHHLLTDNSTLHEFAKTNAFETNSENSYQCSLEETYE